MLLARAKFPILFLSSPYSPEIREEIPNWLHKYVVPIDAPKPFGAALAETIAWLKEFGTSVANGPATVDYIHAYIYGISCNLLNEAINRM